MKNPHLISATIGKLGKSMRERTDAELQQQKREAYGKYMNMVLESSGDLLYYAFAQVLGYTFLHHCIFKSFSFSRLNSEASLTPSPPFLVSLQLEVIFRSSAPFLLCNRNFSASFLARITSHLM